MSRVEKLFSLNGQEDTIIATAQRLGFTTEQIQLLKTPYSELKSNDYFLAKKRGYKSELFCLASICSLDAVGSFRWATAAEDAFGKVDFWIYLNHGSLYPPYPFRQKPHQRL